MNVITTTHLLIIIFCFIGFTFGLTLRQLIDYNIGLLLGFISSFFLLLSIINIYGLSFWVPPIFILFVLTSFVIAIFTLWISHKEPLTEHIGQSFATVLFVNVVFAIADLVAGNYQLSTNSEYILSMMMRILFMIPLSIAFAVLIYMATNKAQEKIEDVDYFF